MPSKRNRFKENRGGRGFGVLNSEDRKFLTPDFDVERQRGEKYVGGAATSARPGVVDSAVLEGDDA